MSTPRRLAVGLLRGPARQPAASWIEARVQVALRANDLGYALIETFELTGLADVDRVALALSESWSRRLDVDCLLLAGMDPDDRIVALADRARLRIHLVDAADAR